MPERPTAAPATLDQTTKRTLDSEPVTEQEKKSWHDLSLTQVLGGALAAMTAAALGSRFSLAGTVVGAALASVIAAVAGALYTASLRRTRETVRAVIGGRPAPAAVLDSSSNQGQPVSGNSAAVPLEGIVDGSAKASRRRTLVVRSLVGAGAIFVLAAGALTTYEALSGHALSGGDGTTFSQVQQRERDDRPADEQAPAPSESADPSSTAEPSEEPSVTPQAEPSPTAEPSAESSAQPSAEPSITPQADPSATAAPPTAAPSQASQPPR
jgi:hypothetical protein